MVNISLGINFKFTKADLRNRHTKKKSSLFRIITILYGFLTISGGD